MGAGGWRLAYAEHPAWGTAQGRGPKEIGGSLLKRWGMWFNSTVPGAPYQPPWAPAPALTRRRGRPPCWRCMAVVSSCCEAWPWVAQRTQPARWGAGAGPASRRPPAPHPAWPVLGRAAEVKSIWPRSAGPHTCHRGRGSGPRGRQPGRAPNPAPGPDCAPHCAHEVETVSNRAAAGRGEARSGSAHTAHHARRARPAGPGPPAPGRGAPDRRPGNLGEVDTR